MKHRVLILGRNMKRTLTLEMTLRDQPVEIEVTVARAEPDVGIMSDYGEEHTVRDLAGNILDWDLTDLEIEQVDLLIRDAGNDDD